MVGSQKAPSGSPTLPPHPSSTQEAPNLPPRVPKSTSGSSKPPELPTRTTPPTAKKAPPELPTRTTPTLTKKSPSPPADEPESLPPPPPSLLEAKPEETAPPPVKAKTKPGEKFDYNRVCNVVNKSSIKKKSSPVGKQFLFGFIFCLYKTVSSAI